MEQQLKIFQDEYESKYVQAQLREEELRLKIAELVNGETTRL
jgi:hypothetical protein